MFTPLIQYNLDHWSEVVVSTLEEANARSQRRDDGVIYTNSLVKWSSTSRAWALVYISTQVVRCNLREITDLQY